MNKSSVKLQCSIVLPIFSGAKNACEIYDRAKSAVDASEFVLKDLIAIDDSGGTTQWEILTESCIKRDIKVIQLMRNFGQHNAIMCGFQHATGDVVITIDDDLQHEPESIPKLLRCLIDRNADLVYGVYEQKRHAGGRNLGSWLVNRFYRLIFRTPVTATSFRAIRRELVNAILRYDLNFTYIDGLLAWNTQRIEMVTVPHHERVDGKSGYTLSKLLVLAMNVFTNFSLLPLQVMSLLGIITAVGGLGLGFWYLIAAVFSLIEVPGYASIIVAVLVLGGLQLLSLGIMGEYLGRLHMNVNKKPQFTIRKTLSNATSTEDISTSNGEFIRD